jgi:hypothetical protein
MHQSHQDADDINDDDLLLRRITPSIHTAPLPDGKRILVGFAFREKHNHEFSMYVAREVSPEKVLSCGLPTQEIVAVRAGDVRKLGYIIVRDPDDCDASHVFAKPVGIKSKSQIVKDCRALAECINASKAGGSKTNPSDNR